MFFKRLRLGMKIGTKALLSHMLLALIVIVLASSLSYALTARYVRQMRIHELQHRAVRIAEAAYANTNGDWMPSRSASRIYEELTDAKVFFIDADTERIRMSRYSADSGDDVADELQWVDVLDTIDKELAQRILAGESVVSSHRFEFMQEDIVMAGVPVRDEAGALLGGLILAQPVAQLHDFGRAMRLIILLVTGGSLILAALLALEQSRRLARPIERITRAARRMADGTYAERITPLPDNEIGDLGRALNSMSARLLHTIRTLRKERDKLEWVITGIGEGLIAVDSGWNIVHVNAAFLELMELDSADAVKSDESDVVRSFRALLNRCIEEGEAQVLEWQNPSGRALHANVSPVKDEEDTILGAECLLRDVSEAQRMEQLRRDYVANISHELRTPLTGIRGMVEPLIDGCMDTEEERQESYRVILKETIRLEKLVGEMLDMSRLQDGRMTVELEPMELPGILEAAARNMQSIADGAGVTLGIDTDGSSLACMGNEDRIMQVLIILLDNALSFTPPGGKVTLFARDAGEWLAVGVRDTGCGIEPKDLPLIWERFYKADKSRMRTTGTGLGLAIAKLVTEMMGGGIEARSEPGKGAEFTFTLRKLET